MRNPILFLYSGLHFRDPEKEQRYRQVREEWLAPRLRLIVLLVALVFLGFIPFDFVFAPQHAPLLVFLRIVTAVAVVVVWLPARLLPARLPMPFITSMVAAVAYLGVFCVRLIVGLESTYEFTEGIMLVQIGVWFLGGMMFFTALVVNLLGTGFFLALELFVVGVPAPHAGISAIYLLALAVLGGFAAWNIERLFRLNFSEHEELETEREAYRLRAMRDNLTGLWNQRAMEERIDAARIRSAANGLDGAVLLIDLDRFKPINDTYGHQAGDDALITVARRIQSVLRSGDSVGRTGGDEFLVLAEDLPDAQFAHRLAERIRAIVESPIRVRMHGDSIRIDVTVGASIGICLFSGDAVATEDIIRTADSDMYRDKAARKSSRGR
jgi:diguanylate cyclase (GGDEF)-like protein